MDYHRTFPFYRWGGYQNMGWDGMEHGALLEDLEYLQQMYPASAKKYQVKIGELLNRMDYDGSMLYDQYPDKWQLERFIDSVMTTLKADAAADGAEDAVAPTDAEWHWIRELVTVLVYNEILRRREKRKNYYFF